LYMYNVLYMHSFNTGIPTGSSVLIEGVVMRMMVVNRVETKVFVFVFSRKLSLFATKYDENSRK
jgi:hypothetical protein